MRQNKVLLLYADYTPKDVVSWVKALYLIEQKKVYLLCNYTHQFIRTPSQTFAHPAVIALKRFVPQKSNKAPTRNNIMSRDHFACQYCGFAPLSATGRPALDKLTLDHVIPKASCRDGTVFVPWAQKHVPLYHWCNIVTACWVCNQKKSHKPLEKSGLTLKRYPVEPGRTETIRLFYRQYQIPEEWQIFIP